MTNHLTQRERANRRGEQRAVVAIVCYFACLACAVVAVCIYGVTR